MADEIKATPRNALLGLLADALGAADSYASQRAPTGGLLNPPLNILSGLLGVGGAARTVDRLSYGEPITNLGKGDYKPLIPADTAEAFAAVAPVIGAIARKAAPFAANSLAGHAARSAKIRAPQQLPQRPFAHDYPALESQGTHGQPLVADIEGRPLTAQFVAGRRTVGGADEGLAATDFDRVLEALGIQRQIVPAKAIGGDAGRYLSSGGNRNVFVSSTVEPAQVPGVLSHELGHAIDDLAGPYSIAQRGGVIPKDGVTKELNGVYDALNSRAGPQRSGELRTGGLWTPAGDKYAAKDHDAERMAEAIRAYLVNPNYLKTVAPKLAARVREYVNGNANLSKVVQFNSAAGAGLLGAAAGDDDAGL